LQLKEKLLLKLISKIDLNSATRKVTEPNLIIKCKNGHNYSVNLSFYVIQIVYCYKNNKYQQQGRSDVDVNKHRSA